jgi:hypothetical protein
MIAASYLDDLGRVRIAITGVPAVVDYVTVERSLDTITWTVIRAGRQVGVSGGTATVDDYEYEPGVLNHYRVSHVDTAAVAYVAGDGAVHADNAAVVPTIAPALQVPGMLLNLIVLCRNAAQTVATPAGWTLALTHQTVRVFQRRWVSGTPNPAVTPAGGVAGDTVSAFIAGFQNAEAGHVVTAATTNASGQNVATPAVVIPEQSTAVALIAHKLAEVTTSTTLNLFQNAQVFSTAVGADQAGLWQVAPASANVTSVAAQTLTITGGVAAVSRAVLFALRRAPWMLRETTTITPINTKFWIKNLRRPNNNIKVWVTGFGDIGRTARTALLDVVNRTAPVAITDLHSGRSMELRVSTETVAEAVELDQRFAAGEVFLFQSLGPDCPIPTMYAIIGSYHYGRPSQRARRRHFTLPLTEVAKPDDSVFSTAVTWADVIATYSTWAAVLAAEPTWSDVLDMVADSEVIVP